MDLDLLEEWVNINSGTCNRPGLERMADALADRLAPLPGSLERVRLAPCATVDGDAFSPGETIQFRFNPEAPVQVLLSGHMDTVYGPDHPFQKLSKPEDGRWQGPGVADMKGGLFIAIEALEQFLGEDSSDRLGGELIITADEEIGSPASRDLLVAAASRHHLGLVFESALPGRELVCRRKGAGTFRISVAGRSAHTGRDFENGRNAIAGLAWCALEAHALNDRIPDALINVGRVSGGGALNVVPDEAHMWLNIRVGTPSSAEKIQDVIYDLIHTAQKRWNGLRFACEGEFTRPPKVESQADAFLHDLWTKSQESLGFAPSGKRETGGSSDGNLFAGAGLPHLDGVGIRGGAIHSPEEFALVDTLPEQIQTTVAFLREVSTHPGLTTILAAAKDNDA